MQDIMLLERRVAAALGILAVAMGTAVLAGWRTETVVLTSLAPGLPAMNPTTAACFMLAGISVWLLARGSAHAWQRILLRSLVWVVLLLGLARSAGYLLRFDPRIDFLLMQSAVMELNPVAPHSAANLALIAAAALLIDHDTPRSLRIAQFLSLLILMVSLLAMLGYVLHTPGFYGVAQYAPMPLNSAIASVGLAAGLLLCRPERGIVAILNSDSPAGLLSRWLLPAAIIVPALIGWLVLAGSDRDLYAPAFGVALNAVMNIALFILLITGNAVLLHRADQRRRRLEEAVRKSEAFYLSLVETVPQSIFRKDLEGRFTFVNKRFADMMGRPIEQIMGATDLELYPRELAEKYRQDDAHVVQTGQSMEAVEKNTVHGETFLVQVVKTPVRDRAGAIIGTQGIFWDVTERLRFQQQLQEKNTELQSLARAEREANVALKKAQAQLVQSEKLAGLGQMVAGVAHEINNPLSFVSNNLAVLQRDTLALKSLLEIYREADAALQAHAADVHARMTDASGRIDLGYTLENLDQLLARSRDGLRRIQQIVKDLRDFARLDESERHAADLNHGIASTVNIIQGQARHRQVQIDLELAPLPPVTCYPAKINQVVMNLLSNAIDACPEKGHVVVRTATEPQGVRIEVTDDGVGIAPENRSRLFDPFFTTKPPGEGTGLGLSISYGIVQDHNGQIEVESEPGRGATFTVHLPLVAPVRKK